MAVVIHDTETTSLEGKILESAHLLVEGDNVKIFEDLCNPLMKINPGAASVHGYWNEDVETKPVFEETPSFASLKQSAQKGDYYVAHNALFDLEKLTDHGIFWQSDKVIDTFRVSTHLFKNSVAENNKLQYFRFLLGITPKMPEYNEKMRMLGLSEVQPHTALSDIFILWIFLDKLKEMFNKTNDDLVRLSQKIVFTDEVTWGNVFEEGSKFDDILFKTYNKRGSKGYEYLDWSLGNMDMFKTNIDKQMSVVHVLAKNIVDGKIPMKAITHNDPKMLVRMALLITFDEEYIEKAEKLLRTKRVNLARKSLASVNKKIAEHRKDRKEKLKELTELYEKTPDTPFPDEEGREIFKKRQKLEKEMSRSSNENKMNVMLAHKLSSILS